MSETISRRDFLKLAWMVTIATATACTRPPVSTPTPEWQTAPGTEASNGPTTMLLDGRIPIPMTGVSKRGKST